ncbi:uncharacterized protein LOC134754616 [Cydia strobilella]|uniref:uncharacterized protein LOC134754616 n=1 Tax=Cydia strobilella TaxID=1100964 RepID=UPI0030079DF8
MPMKVWILKSIVVVQLATALRFLPLPNKLNVNSQAPIMRRTNLIEKMLLASVNQDKKSLQPSRPKNNYGTRTAIRQLQEPVDSPVVSPQKMAKEQVEEQELGKLVRSSASELLGKPYVETRGRNDYLVIQSNNMDPFVTVVPNSIYYDVEKKCVNWLDACSLKGIRAHLLQRVQDPTAQ